MTLKIDFDNKIVEVDDSTEIGVIVDKLKELKLDWREFKIKPTVSYYPYYPYIPYNQRPWRIGDVWYTTSGGTQLKEHTPEHNIYTIIG